MREAVKAAISSSCDRVANFKDKQKEAITSLVQGTDMLVIPLTGYGKSLCTTTGVQLPLRRRKDIICNLPHAHI